MKKLLYPIAAISFALSLSSCSTVQHNRSGMGINKIDATNLEALKIENLNITKSVSSEKGFDKFWLLFIPFGSKTEETRREYAYLKACKENGIDGILQPKYQTEKLVVPLVLFTYVNYKTTVFGKGYTIKSTVTDAQIQTTDIVKKEEVAMKKVEEVVKPAKKVEVPKEEPKPVVVEAKFKRGDYVLYNQKKCIVVSVVNSDSGFIRELGTKQNREAKFAQLSKLDISVQEVEALEAKKK
ncbi:hypothetical protein [Flectobacillus sp. BAB-3569]|uniref:hypothetical protein n=1 Tax=Flectobacillus sp. BAB-3569 TaxID=1509483 RepID=UPI000BA4DB74|nr:hypothetical protein [Flectobacillus sp. BAB-3569]PAC33282.1 hypothetical protein BWI92_01900 [Flectobacillus sp. BAB-3569]